MIDKRLLSEQRKNYMSSAAASSTKNGSIISKSPKDKSDDKTQTQKSKLFDPLRYKPTEMGVTTYLEGTALSTKKASDELKAKAHVIR